MIAVLVVVYVAVIAVAAFFFLRFSKQATQGAAASAESRVITATTAQEFLPFESISGGVVKLDANKYRAYLNVEPVNFYYMTAGEQEALEAGFRSFLDGLRFPVQISVNSVPLDISEHLEQLEKGQGALSPELQAYAAELAAATREWVAQYSPITKRYTVVVCFDYVPDPRRPIRPEIVEQQARQELDQRCQQVIESLGRAGLAARRMGDDEILALFYQILNRHSGASIAARNLVDADLTSVYTTKAAGATEGR